MKINIGLFLGTSIASAALSSAALSFNYDEALDGDLSNDYLAPTVLTIGEGSNLITGLLSGGGNDLDMFRLVVPEGLEIVAIELLAFSGGDNGSFLIMQPGDTLSSAPSITFGDPAGFSIISPGGVGSDLLPTITLPSVPTLPPFFGASTLGAGNYAGWLNETGSNSSYQLSFVASAVPEPAQSVLLLLGLLGGSFARRRSLQ